MARQYFDSLGLAATRYTERPLGLAKIAPDDYVLDVGCGRGEIVFQSAARGASATGIDFSSSAIEIASETRLRHEPAIRDRTRFLESNGESLPFAERSFNKVFMVDVVEHLGPAELRGVLTEILRVIRDDGMLIVHTTENRWNNTYGYWLDRGLRAIHRRPPAPAPTVAAYQRVRADPDLDERKWFMHVNEQSVASLKLALTRAGFSNRVWIGESGNVWNDKPGRANAVKRVVYDRTHLELLCGDHIFATATPRHRR